MRVNRLVSYNKRCNNAKILKNLTKPKPFYPKPKESMLFVEDRIREIKEQIIEMQIDVFFAIYGKFTDRERLKNSIKIIEKN